MSVRTPDISIIIPTYHEGVNLPLLLPRIASALAPTGRSYEVLIVDDDSRDGTEQVVEELARDYPVELIVRKGWRDLSLAVVEGFQRARGRFLVVLDADLSHPPEKILALLEALEDPGTDFVIGSRFVPGGRAEEFSGYRRLNSYAARLLCRPLSGPIADPMAGFFALRRATLDRAERLDPIGYKIALELICRCQCRRIIEVPITFHNRTRGQSKLDLEQQRRYLIHLDRLYRTYHRGWGLAIRPLLRMMSAALAVVQSLHYVLKK